MDLRFIPPPLQRLWTEEVLYLHSLWRRGPPPNPNPNRNDKKRKNSEIEWPVNPSSFRSTDFSAWPDPIPNPNPNPNPKAIAICPQRAALRSCQDFFSNDEMSDEEEDGDEEETNAFEFFLRVFERDAELRGYYEKNYEKGEFLCLVCGGIGVKVGKRYGNCVGLVQHSNAISKTKRRGAHRGFGRAVCKVIGWNIDRLPSIVLDVGQPLGKSLDNADEVKENLKRDACQQIGDISEHSVVKEVSNQLVDFIKPKEIEMPNKDVVEEITGISDHEVVKEVSIPDLVDFIKPKEIEMPDEVKDDKELLIDSGEHPEGSKKNKMKNDKKEHPISSPSYTRDEESVLVQQNALKACHDFLAKLDSSSNDGDNDEEEMRKRESVAFKFFSMLFDMNCHLKSYYEKNHSKGEFCCLVCGAIGMKMGKRFGDCGRLLQHSKTVSEVKRKWVHRAFGRAVCQVLGWELGQ